MRLMREYDYQFNFFKWFDDKAPSENIQSYPHQDSTGESHIASVTLSK